MRRNKQKKPEPKHTMLLASLLANMRLKRVSYSYQLLKQFFLFPDDTESSQKTVDQYDKLIFSDEEIHTMFRKLETKLLGTKMWAFLNLKYFRIVKALHIMERPVKAIEKKKSIEHMEFSFIKIKTFSQIKSKRFRIQRETDINIGNPYTPKKSVKPQTELQYGKKDSPVRETNNIKESTSKRNRSRSNQNFKIKIDIQHSTCHCQPSQMYSPSRVRVSSPSGINIQSESRIRAPPIVDRQPPVSYPISQIHPMQPRLSVEKAVLPSGSTLTSFIRQEAQSPSQVRYNNVPPENVKVCYNDRPKPEQYDRTVVRSPSRPEDNIYGRAYRHQNQRDVHIRNEYGTNKGGRIQNNENSPYCHACRQRHPCCAPCPARSTSGRKVKRLRSTSRGNTSYLHNINK